MIGCRDGLPATTATASAEWANLHFRFGINRDSQALIVSDGRFASLFDIREDRVGFRNLFSGSVFFTGRIR
jgi:hypothetical protein